jgi:hypothetical protein
VIVIAAYSDFNEHVVKAGVPLAGNQLPILPLGLALLVAAAWNPLAGRLWRRLRLTNRELTVALVVMLVSAWLPGYGVYRSFSAQLVRPWTHLPQHPDWQQHATLDHLPSTLFPLRHDELDPRYQRVYGDWETGIGSETHLLPVRMVPWSAWLPVMAYWGPLLLLMAVALGSLAVLVHRQWSLHEQLPYPLAAVYAAAMPGPGRTLPPVMRSRLFWIGTLVPFIYFGENWLCITTQHVPWIPNGFWYTGEIHRVFPALAHTSYNGVGWIHCAGAGLAYFVASEVGFTIATTYMIYAAIAAEYYLLSGDVMSATDGHDTTAGAFIGYAIILLITGRTYYRSALVHALRILRPGEDRVAPWAARMLLLASLAMIWLLSACFGFDWFIACVYVAALLLFFLVVSRVICETGIPFMQAELDIAQILAGTLGLSLIGPGSLTVMYWLGSILNFDTRVCFMPFAANSLRLAEKQGVRLRALVPAGLVAIVLSIGIGFAASIYSDYAVGGKRDQYHVLIGATDSTLGAATAGIASLTDSGRLGRSEATHGLAKLVLLGENNEHGRQLGWMAFGVLGVIGLSLARFRWPGFLIHPILFVLWSTWPAQVLWFPFLVGWIAKTAIVRYGGGKAYEAGKPFFLGMILGEVMITAFFVVANLVIYLVSGRTTGSGYFGG